MKEAETQNLGGGGFLFDLLPLNFCQLASKCCKCYDYCEAASGYQKQSSKLLRLLLSFLSQCLKINFKVSYYHKRSEIIQFINTKGKHFLLRENV